MSLKSDILILGATGYIGRLVTRYLCIHPQRRKFKFALGARSPLKLRDLLEDLSLQNDSTIDLIQVDVTRQPEVEKAVMSTRVIVNTVGPYWLLGTLVVAACAKHGVHYVDLTNETVWIKDIIQGYDFTASKSGAIIVPSCGFNSIPSDISVHLSSKTLKSLPTPLEIGSSVTAHKLRLRGGISGGMINSILTVLEGIAKKGLKDLISDYSISPVVGHPSPRLRLYYKLLVPGTIPSKLKGAYFFMSPVNKAMVQRTFGLLELEARTSNTKEIQSGRYGPAFVYEEFMIMSGTVPAILFTMVFVAGVLLLVVLQPVYFVVKKFLPQSGDGPSDEDMQRGLMVTTNISKSASDPPVYVKSVIKGNGDPVYLLSAIMISESALSLILPQPLEKSAPQEVKASAFPRLTYRRGGILTPMTAFGDILIKRLEVTGRFEFSSSTVAKDNVKT